MEKFCEIICIDEEPKKIQDFLEELFLAYFQSEDVAMTDVKKRQEFVFLYKSLRELFDEIEEKFVRK